MADDWSEATTRVLWPDASLESVSMDYDDVRVTVEQSNGRRAAVIGRGYIGAEVVGLWDEAIVKSANIAAEHPFRRRCERALAEQNRKDRRPSGSMIRNLDDKHVLEIELIDGCRILLCASRFDVVDVP